MSTSWEIVAELQIRNVGGLKMALEMGRSGWIPERFRKSNLQELVVV